ncbi:adventurous gliding motility lipoprotein CglB [Vitiosangium sp. GDMCC 1.1324]|uniref:adventurous gliding motility lipoprotein CglB n=1 Tax=Vitiosangium sp. (strain GDMCC 1.1324) TaxID=2138576 RepID=UPI000D3BC543|nr:adventurous gliding motility lipoprotein CglB [Vitiosangium sp. GDMCC 1.1324]PTL78357.1 gliding motility protein [Vitiosangium sp. GDMCC 1.1324]
MRAKLTLLSALVLGTVIATGCQTYDFEPVEPLAISQTTKTRVLQARQAKPNLMLLVDTSGSMTLPVNPALPACNPGGSRCGSKTLPCDTSVCATRWSSLQDAMKDFLTRSGSIARFGLATYPDLNADKDYQCGGATGLTALTEALPEGEADDVATLTNKATNVNNKLQAIKNSSSSSSVTVPAGGTPTSLSLRFVGNNPALQSAARSNFVLLLTDGLPNCNPQNVNAYPSANCRCTLDNPEFCKSAPYDNLGCLDKDGSVVAVQELKAKNISTIVIGFGAETATGTGPEVLNAMARAGGFSDTYFQAANKDELVTALRKISETINVAEPCVIKFEDNEAPSSQELVVVYLNGDRVASGPDTWNLSGNTLTFTGSTCARIEASTSASPVNIEVRAVQRQ